MVDTETRYLEDLQTKHPDIASLLSDFATLYQRKLWHPLTVKLEESLQLPEFGKDGFLIDLYSHFISHFGHRINLLKLAQFAVRASQQFDGPQQAVEFLEKVRQQIKDAKLYRSEAQPQLYLQAHIAECKLDLGDVAACKTLQEECRQTLDSMQEVDPSVSAAVCWVSSQYYKFVKDFAQFYKSSLLYLAFIATKDLDPDKRQALAADISLAALLGKGVYSFGELLLHPIVQSLEGTQYDWLMRLLDAFHRGDMAAYDQLCKQHAATLNSMPELVANERLLKEKITIMCLLELIFRLPAEERSISLADIGAHTQLDVDGVEFLLMKALSLNLIHGTIDQVDQRVQVSWVQPRVLTVPQIQGLKQRLDDWVGKVDRAVGLLDDEEPSL